MKKYFTYIIVLLVMGCFQTEGEYGSLEKGSKITGLETGADIQAGDIIEWSGIPSENNYKLYLITNTEEILLYEGPEHSFQMPLMETTGSYTLRLESYSEVQFFTNEISINVNCSLPVVSGIEYTNNVQPEWTWEELDYATKYRFGWNEGEWIFSETTELSYTPSQTLSEGAHILYVQAMDDNGYCSGLGSFTINVDLTSPEITDWSPSGTIVAGPNITVYFNEPMNSNTVQNTANYSVDFVSGTTGVAITGVIYDDAANSAAISVDYLGSDGTEIYTITPSADITDLAGNFLISSVSNNYRTTPTNKDWTASGLIETGPNITTIFSTDMNASKTEDLDNWEITYSSGSSGVEISSVSYDNPTRTATITVSNTNTAGDEVYTITPSDNILSSDGDVLYPAESPEYSAPDIRAPVQPTVVINDGDGYINAAENAAGITVVISGEANADYTITPTNALVTEGYTGNLGAGGSVTLNMTAYTAGDLLLSVVLTDASGNDSNPGTDSSIADFDVPDTPTVTINDGDGYISFAENTASVEFTITGTVDIDYTITPTNCTITEGNTGNLGATGTIILHLTASADGTAEVSVHVTNAAQTNSLPDSDNSMVDLTAPDPPVILIDGGDSYINQVENLASVEFTITGESNADYVITPTNCTVTEGNSGNLGGTGSISLHLTAAAEGTVEISALLTDTVDNTGTSDSDTIIADFVSPTNIPWAAAGVVAPGGTVTTTFSEAMDQTSVETVGNYTCSIVGVSVSNVSYAPGTYIATLTMTYTGYYAPQNYTITPNSNITDAAGNPLTPTGSQNYKAYWLGQAGGVVFYDAGSAQGWGQYLEVAPESTRFGGAIQWGCYGTNISGTSTAIGTGENNTSLIIAGCAEAGRAAMLCNDLDYGGYTDWFLPSYNELDALRTEIFLTGIYSFPGTHWCSTQQAANYAYALRSDLTWIYYSKHNPYYAIAIRSFY